MENHFKCKPNQEELTVSNISHNADKGKLTKKHRKARCGEIIKSYDVDTYFTKFDIDELNSLLGAQFQSAMRRINSTYPSDPAHLWVLYDMGDWTPVSWNNLISPKSDRQKRHKAMRFSVASDIDDLRNTMGAECENCGASENLQVDHLAPPFMQIADEFISDNGMFEIINNDDGAGWVFLDQESEALWIAFHASRATYQVLCRSCNASKGAK